MLTAAQLQSICPRCKDVEAVAKHLNNAVEEFGVTDEAMFVAQLAHESGEFRYVRELASGTAYEGRRDLGNDEAGDGPRYKGRGYIQITGKSNYRDCANALGIDLIRQPELLELPALAASSAGWYWKSRQLNGLSLEACTKRINGGYNGLESRRKYYLKAQSVLDSQAPAPVEEKSMPLPAIAAAVLPAIISAAPDLFKIFTDKGASVPEKNVAAASKVLEIAKDVTGAVNEQEAAEKMQEPEHKAAFQQAVQERWFELVESGGGGIDGARKANLDAMSTPLWHQPALWVTAALVPLVYLVVYAVLFKEGATPELKIQVVTAVISGVLGAVTGFWMGTSFGSQRKTDMLAKG